MNKAEIMEVLKNQQAYDRYDRHMGEERILDVMTEKFEQRIVPLERRTTSLEHYRTAIGASMAAILAWLKFSPQVK